MDIQKNQEYVVDIIDNGFEGEGIAKIDNFTIFIPGAIKGEKIKILIVKVLSSHAFGKILEIINKSNQRQIEDCNTYKMLTKGVNIGIGTDSAASNNGLDIMREMYLAAILPKGIQNRAAIITPQDIYKMTTVNGYKAQGRNDCGVIKEGYRADLIVLDLDKPNMYPDFDVLNNLVYSANKSDVVLTMVDGKVLYKNGEFTTIDVEKMGAEVSRLVREVEKEVQSV
mgnify:CR=1 FL=1